MEPSQQVSSAADRSEDSQADFECRLPADGEATWEKSCVGSPNTWPQALQALATTIASFPYPTAVFWGDEFVLLHNQSWLDAGGVSAQGEKRRGKFSADAWQALNASKADVTAIKVQGHKILGSEDVGNNYLVLLSPLFGHGADGVAGVMAQLLPQPPSGPDAQKGFHQGGSYGHTELDSRNADQGNNLDDVDLAKSVDSVPLNEHPFFHRFAEMLPSGLAILDQRAQAIFVNQHFYELTTHKGDDQSFKSWPQSIHPEDYDRVMNIYHESFRNQTQLRTEFRALGHTHPWRLLLLTPLGDENLQHVSLNEYGGFICSIVDISSEKSAELAERKAAKEAHERKEQQERFIDMISHEIRNPLSAIMHCTEDIEDAIYRADHDSGKVDTDEIRHSLETISMCLAHQRNIVDDVLSFSKLDASMLSIRPKPCQPARQLATSMKMFSPEFRKQEIDFEYKLDPCYNELKVEWVLADIARVGQVLVNLVTNAVKFTARSEGEKKITVQIGCSRERPQSYPPGVVRFDQCEDSNFRMDATNTKDWGKGEELYVIVAVQDTGIGISQESQKKLFERFRQATPKTEEIYGGSGLGLNISRKICHLHGGEISVAAKEGEGSIFSFFFKTRRTAETSDEHFGDDDSVATNEQLKKQICQAGNADPSETTSDMVPKSVDKSMREHEQDTSGGSDKKDKQLKDFADRLPGEVRGSEASVTTKSQDSSFGRPKGTHSGHVLLVEDNIINQKILHRKLKALGYTISTANNGKEAVAAVRNAPRSSAGEDGAFDVILMDQEMPLMDGSTAATEIRDLEKSGQVDHLPILGVTANVRGAQQEGMIESGMDDVIGKPYKMEEMVKKLDSMTEEHN